MIEELAGALTDDGAAAQCGDANGDSEVTVDEVLTMVNIALSAQPITSCPAGDANHDGEITVDEIIAAVNIALTACPLT